MSYSLVETYLDSPFTIGEDTYPGPCLVEDDDQVRILVLPEIPFPASIWTRASAAGAAAILISPPGFVFWAFTEVFLSKRTERHSDRSYDLSIDYLRPVSPPFTPSYSEMVEADGDDAPSTDFVHLHAHSEFSQLDGLSLISEMVDAAVSDGQEALAITDHGYCSSHPQLSKLAMAAGIKPIFGLEAYFVADRHARGPGKLILSDEPAAPTHPFAADPEFVLLPRRQWSDEQIEKMARYEQEKKDLHRVWEEQKGAESDQHKLLQKKAKDYYHLILWAMDQKGLRNLWAMSTAGFLSGFYGKPRIDWEILETYNEGVMCSTACLRGPFAHPLMLNEDHELAHSNAARLQGIFGDRLYAEIHTNQLPDQIKVNEATIEMASSMGIHPIAVVDSHYACADDQHTHQVWLAAQTGGDLYDDKDLFAGAHEYHMMGVDEVRKNLSYLPSDVVDAAISNTGDVAARCSAVIKPKIVLPIYTKPGTHPSDDERVSADVERVIRHALGTPEDGYANFHRRCSGKSKPLDVYMKRFEKEMDLLIRKKFCGYFLMTERQVRWAKEAGCLVGPGRGSGGGCLVAYLLDITEMDPVEADLLFERFLTDGRDEPPDFDIDYPTSWRDRIQDFCTTEWGDEHTARVGTHIRLKSKGVFSDLARIFSDDVDYKDFVEVSKIIDRAEAGSAGLGLSWDDLWVQHGDELEPYRQKYPKIFVQAEKMRGRLKTYARHAAGMVISPDEVLNNNLPLRTSDNSAQPITQFDMDSLTMLGYIKFDLLTLRTLDTLQECIDLIKVRRGVRVNVYDWREEYNDPQVWDEICNGNTKGIFQIETPDGTRMTKKFQPRSLSHLADVITLVRPGPKRSGLTDSYLRRKAGYEDITLPDPRLADVLEPTYGCIIYQEQVMKACQVLGGYTLNEADAVRRILGKKKVELVQAAGDEFIPRCVEQGMELQDVERLWEQLGEFAKYSFNKSHAWAYAMIGFWTAWFKFHYPIEFLTAALSTVEKSRVPEFVNEARRMGYSVLPPDINESKGTFTAGSTASRFGFEAIDGIGEAASNDVLVGQPYTSFNDFMERKGPKANKGHIKKMAMVGVFDSIEPDRRGLVERLEWDDSPESTTCQLRDPGVNNKGLPCTYNWDEEPVEIGKSGRPKKQKPPPKRCTKSCRQYLPPEQPAWSEMDPYTPAQIRGFEKDLLGIYLSSTPFDRFDKDDLQSLATGTEIDLGPVGFYATAAIITKVKPYKARNGEMGFLGIMCQDVELDCVVFNDNWMSYKSQLKPGTLCILEVKKTPRGLQMTDTFIPIHEET